MRRIVKRFFVRDHNGRLIALQSEHLRDDEAGQLFVTHERSAVRCTGCQAAVEFAEQRGRCDVCRSRGCCIHCLSRCGVCSRQLCGHCRRGFAGPPALTVCSECQRQLGQRQQFVEHVQRQQHAFDNAVTRQRLGYQARALQLAAQRQDAMQQFLRARLGLNRVHWFPWLLGKCRVGISGTYRHVRQLLR